MNQAAERLDAWHLPWTVDTAPHALLDINRGCNISCRACYAVSAPHIKTLEQTEVELRELVARRPLHSISIIGGEILLHPELCRIVEMAKKNGLLVELFTNGLLLDRALCGDLKHYGADMIFLHIDHRQKRSDLFDAENKEALRRLREEKAVLVAEHGMECGLAVTAYEDGLEQIVEAVELVLNSPHIHYLLVTLERDTAAMGKLRGGIKPGIAGLKPKKPFAPALSNARIARLIHERFGLEPFAMLGSTADRRDPRWLSYYVPVLLGGQRTRFISLRASAAEKCFLYASRLLRGRYPFLLKQNRHLLQCGLLLNCAARLAFAPGVPFLLRSLNRPGLYCKRLLLQDPAYVAEDGSLVHCLSCPDAVLKNGELVPVCVTDMIAEEESA